MKFKYFILASCLTVCLSVFLVVNSCGGRGGAGNNNNNGDDRPSTPPPKDSTSAECQPGGGDCTGDSNCENQCDNGSDADGVFRTSSTKKDCKALSKNEVARMYEVFGEEGILADSSPDLEDEGDDICVSAIGNLLEIDKRGRVWLDYVNDYNSSSAGDVARWLAENTDVFKTMDKKMSDSDLSNFVDKLLKRINSKIIVALTTDISEDSDGEYFLGVAAGENDKAVEVVHELGSGSCLSEAGSAKQGNYTSKAGDTHKEAACMMGEVYCKKDSDGFYFEDTFEDILDDADGLKNYIRDTDTSRKGLAQRDTDIETVCPAFCTKMGGSGAAKPSACSS